MKRLPDYPKVPKEKDLGLYLVYQLFAELTQPASKRKFRTAQALSAGQALVPWGPMPSDTPASIRVAIAVVFIKGRPGALTCHIDASAT